MTSAATATTMDGDGSRRRSIWDLPRGMDGASRKHSARPSARGSMNPVLTPKLLSADHLHDHCPLPGAVVEVDQHELLPGAELEPAGAHGNRLGRPHDGRADVGMRVGVV